MSKRKQCEDSEKGKEKVLLLSDEEMVSEEELETSEPTAKKRSGFRLCSKQLYLTYPKCAILAEDCLQLLKEKLGEILEYIIAQEKHKVIFTSLLGNFQ